MQEQESALSSIAELSVTLRTQLGEKQRRHEKDTYASMAGDALVIANGTIKWDGPRACQFGYESVWQYVAGTYHPDAQGAKPKQRAEVAEENAHIYKIGFDNLAAKLMERFGIPLIKVPMKIGGKVIVCITVNPDSVVNAAHQTAREVYSVRELKRAVGQINAVYPRIAAVNGQQTAVSQMYGAIAEAIDQPRLPGV